MSNDDASSNPNIPVNGINGLLPLQMARFAPIEFKEHFKTAYFIKTKEDALAACQEIHRCSPIDMCAMLYLDAGGQLIGYDMRQSLVNDPLKVIRDTIRNMITRGLLADADKIVFAFYHALGDEKATLPEKDLVCNIDRACWESFLKLHSAWCFAPDGRVAIIEQL